MRPIPFSLLPILTLLLGACSLQWPGSDAAAPETTSSVAANKLATAAPRLPKAESNDGGYRLDAGDRVRVVVAGQDALSGSYDVDSGGAIEIAPVGKISARGLSTVQLSSAIAKRLKKTGGPETHVAVQVETYRPISIYGDVANPGKYPYVNNMTAETAIEMAGGLKSSGDRNAVAVSNGPQRRPAALTSPVQPGDTLTITEQR
jgi:polysaccharide export outer membrane protein